MLEDLQDIKRYLQTARARGYDHLGVPDLINLLVCLEGSVEEMIEREVAVSPEMQEATQAEANDPRRTHCPLDS